jgi:Tfp pilus assembly protein PilO
MKTFFQKNRREWIITAIVVTVAVAVELLVVMPKKKATQKIRGRIVAVKSQVEQSAFALEEFVKMSSEDKSTPDLIIGPEEDILPQLLESISELGEKHNLEILSLKPQKIQLVKLPADEQYGFEAETKRLHIVMKVKATYRDLGNYFKALEAIPILVAVRGLKLKKEHEGSTLLFADFTIETYSIKAHEKEKI